MAFTACKKDEPQRKIKIIDIPAEYNGHRAFLHLDNDNYMYGIMGVEVITNGEVTSKITDTRGPYLADPPSPLTENAEYYVKFQILDRMDSDTLMFGSVILSVKSDDIIGITKEITTISFATLTKE